MRFWLLIFGILMVGFACNSVKPSNKPLSSSMQSISDNTKTTLVISKSIVDTTKEVSTKEKAQQIWILATDTTSHIQDVGQIMIEIDSQEKTIKNLQDKVTKADAKAKNSLDNVWLIASYIALAVIIAGIILIALKMVVLGTTAVVGGIGLGGISYLMVLYAIWFAVAGILGLLGLLGYVVYDYIKNKKSTVEIVKTNEILKTATSWDQAVKETINSIQTDATKALVTQIKADLAKQTTECVADIAVK